MVFADFFLFEWVGSLANSIEETYGVNPWVYLFIWWIAAAPLWYLGIYWAFKGLADTNPELFRKGVFVNRVGYAMAPLYVILFGDNLGFVVLFGFAIPIAWSWWFYKYRLLNEEWVEKNRGWMSSLGRFFEVALKLPFKPKLWPHYARLARKKAGELRIMLRLVIWTKIKVRIVQPGTAEYEAVAAVEKAVFEELGYPYEYRKYDGQSFLLGAFDGKKAIGALRLIGATKDLLPPVITDCKIKKRGSYSQKALEGLFEELGTVAILREYRSRMVSVDLYRAATDCARKRGVLEWGIIIEPERAQHMNDRLHFGFWQEGDLGFHGWDCAPFVLNIEDTLKKIKKKDRVFYFAIKKGKVMLPDPYLKEASATA